MRRLVISIVTAVVLLVLFVVLFTFVRRPYESVLLDRFGTLIPESQQVRLAYNWYLKMPSDTVVRVDQRLHLYQGPLQEVITKAAAPISVQTYAAWRIVDPVKFYKKTSGSDHAAETTIDARIRGLVGTKFGEHTMDEFFNMDQTKVNSEKLEAEISREATEGSPDNKIPGLKEMGLEIAQIGFSRMAFPPNVTESVYQRMVAELSTKARDLESKGLADASEIRAKGDQQAESLRSNARVEAGTIMGKADREAMSILSGVQTTEAARKFYEYWKSLDFMKASLTKNTVMVLSPDSPLLGVGLGNLLQAPVEGAGRPAATQPSARAAARPATPAPLPQGTLAPRP